MKVAFNNIFIYYY